MSYEAKVIKDSVSEDMVRLPTLQTKFPTMILQEVLTHRVFSRNASSGRAIPVKRVIEELRNDPAMPVYWGRNEPGMVANEEHDKLVYLTKYQDAVAILGIGDSFQAPNTLVSVLKDSLTAKGLRREDAWLQGRDNAIELAQAYMEAGYHKQIVNRIMQPWMHTHMVISSTYWQNYRYLRLAADAQPEIRVLAEHMSDALDNSKPRLVRFGDWHLPYVRDAERADKSIATLKQYSAARIARVSYNNHDGTAPSHDKDVKLYADLLSGEGGVHGSPFEHPSTPVPNHKASNYYGWMQLRELVDRHQPRVEYYNGDYFQ